LPPLVTFWFFTTPILYSASYLPESIQNIAQYNPMAWFVTRLRELLLFGEINLDFTALVIVTFIVVFAWASLRFFRRFSGHFEDFL
ncbi:MAG: phosphate ABC transporter permease, partial [Gammaproteobacteria bacterium]|nr:phosphate ABC transporter permease [Gammaproteobacteria bacterium]